MVTTFSLPPTMFLTSGGSSDSTTAPISQNQLVTSAPHHSRRSLRRCRISSVVERTMLVEVTRAGAGLWKEQARSPAQQREHQHEAGERGRVAAVLRRQSADDGAEQDRHE